MLLHLEPHTCIIEGFCTLELHFISTTVINFPTAHLEEDSSPWRGQLTLKRRASTDLKCVHCNNLQTYPVYYLYAGDKVDSEENTQGRFSSWLQHLCLTQLGQVDQVIILFPSKQFAITAVTKKITVIRLRMQVFSSCLFPIMLF